jgi:hypothetical protein
MTGVLQHDGLARTLVPRPQNFGPNFGGFVHSRTPILLKFLVRLPSRTATGGWRETARTTNG